MKNKEKIRTDLLELIPALKDLRESCGESELCLVGGSLRNLFIGVPVYDWDFVTTGDARKIALDFADNSRASFVVLDEEYGIYRVVPRGGAFYFDFAKSRGEVEEDLFMRDFTINAIALDVKTGRLIDPSGGADDIRNRLIRTTRKENITDDPLRILRAYRFKAKFDFEIEEETGKTAKYLCKLMEKVSYERIRDEFFKILETDCSARIIRDMLDGGVIDVILPELIPLTGMDQNDFHLYDVLTHSIVSLEEFDRLQKEEFKTFGLHKEIRIYLNQKLAGDRSRLETLKFAILMHDVGKATVRRVEKGKLFYIGHHTVGADMWEEAADRFKLSKKEKVLGKLVIEHHLAPVFLPQFEDEEKQKIRTWHFFRDTKQAAPATILLSWCDVEAGRGKALTKAMIDKHHEYSIMLLDFWFKKAPAAFPPALIGGKEVMQVLQMAEGTEIGRIMKRIEELTAIGRITTKKEALDFLEEEK